METVLGMIYMSIGVRVGLLHWYFHSGERCIASAVLAEEIFIEILRLGRSEFVW